MFKDHFVLIIGTEPGYVLLQHLKAVAMVVMELGLADAYSTQQSAGCSMES